MKTFFSGYGQPHIWYGHLNMVKLFSKGYDKLNNLWNIMAWNFVVRELQLIVSWIWYADSYISIADKSCYIFRNLIINLVFSLKCNYFEMQDIFSFSHFYHKWFMLQFFAFISRKIFLRKLMKCKTVSFNLFGNILNLFEDISRTPAMYKYFPLNLLWWHVWFNWCKIVLLKSNFI